MRRLAILLALGDVALAVYLVVALLHRREAADDSGLSVATHVSLPTNSMAAADPNAALADNQDSHERKLKWALLALSDLHACVANLREVGCPETTIQDIIVAEVNRRFAPRERSLKLRYEDYELWDAPSQGTRSMLEARSQLAALYSEKKALLKDLLGVDIAMPLPKILNDRSSTQLDAALANLPEAKRDQVKNIQETYLTEIQRLRASTVNFMEQADISALVRLKAERRVALTKALTAEELLDFDLQTSGLAQTVQFSLGKEAASDTEFREVFKRIQGKYDQALTSGDIGDQTALIDTMTKFRAEIRTGDAFKDILGDQRVAELKQARDPMFQRLKQAAMESGLPPQVVENAYAIQQAAMQEFTSRMSNPDMSNEERRKAATEYSQKMMTRVREVLGDEGYRKFMEASRPASSGQRPIVQPRPQPK